MPELPEVRAQAHRLGEHFRGRLLDRFEALSFTALKTFDPPPDAARGLALSSVGSRGKHLLVGFEPYTFVVHLMQGGRLEPDVKQAAKPRGCLARWRFGDGSALLLTEAGREHRAGVWVLEGPVEGRSPLDDLGPEADEIAVDDLAMRLAASSTRLHGFLRDQRQLAGLGRRLANEVCRRAKLSPFASTRKLTEESVVALGAAIGAAIAESLEYEAGQDHMTRSAERPVRVHHRAGEPCPECGDVVRAVSYNAYTVNSCATCQTGGKILADNTTSRFLK
ncbi:MAG: Fpg/Nei family DNA glycosylase [Microthrixaceae bacterium]|nr:Fpg/Nei family DNA glycosylase [Microthrixaceae bacterium]